MAAVAWRKAGLHQRLVDRVAAAVAVMGADAGVRTRAGARGFRPPSRPQ